MVGASMVVCKVRVGGPRAKRPWAAEARWALVGRDRASMVMFCMAMDGGGGVMARRARASRAKVRWALVRARASKASGHRARVSRAWALRARSSMVKVSGASVGSPGLGILGPIEFCVVGYNVFLVAGREDRVASCASAPLGSKADAIRAIRCKQVE